MSHPSPRGPWLGGDGLITFLLSNLVLAGSAGLTGLLALRRTWRTACHAPVAIRCDLLLVAGMKLTADGRITPDYRARLERAFTLWQSGGCRRLLLLGGETRPGLPSEARAGRDWLSQHGIPPAAMLMEERSRHTLENLTEARALLRAMARSGEPAGAVGLISSRYHLARIDALARGLSLAPLLCAAEPSLPRSPARLIRICGEAYYLHWYHVGRIWSRLTRNRESLARIS